jgi:hypothetical protein
MFAVLRDPADRAYSAYLHVVRQARERRSFADSLKEEPMRVKQKWNSLWHFKSMGFYYAQVKRYYDMFGRDKVHIYLYEDFQKQPLPLIKGVLDILGVDNSDSFSPDTSKRYKRSYVPRSPVIERVVHSAKTHIDSSKKYLPAPLAWRTQILKKMVDRLASANRVSPPPVPQDVRASLIEDYRDDVLRLGDLLQRDLSHWLKPNGGQPTGSS